MSPLQESYEQRLEAAKADHAKLLDRSNRVANLRGLTFVIGAAAWGARFGEGSPAWTVVALLASAAFVVLLLVHGRVISACEHAERRAVVLERALLRRDGRFAELPDKGEKLLPADHPYAADLDLFGPGSLYQRISVAHTRMGESRLAELLLRFDSIEECEARHASVRELAEALDFRIELEAESLALAQKRRRGALVSAESPDPEPLLRFIERKSGLSENPVLGILAYVLPLATITLGILQLLGKGTPYLWVVPWALGIGLLGATGKTTGETFNAVSVTEGAFLRYAKILRLIEDFDAKSPVLKREREKLSNSSGTKTSVLLEKFQSLVGYYELRHSGMVYPAINSVLLWDIHCTLALERWRRPIGERAREWFKVIGQWESLSSFATLLADDPGASFPQFVTKAEGFSAEQLGHPLIASGRRVSNDVAAFRPGEGLLVTGSNMSGKSTFLRAIGVNLVLAFAGAPVIARRLSVPPCELGTSLRISDSLQSGVSHFYAEVKKLASVVSVNRAERPVFFLLDEILHGTNSRERTIGARWVLTRLLEQNAFGVVTTHDEKLAEPTPEMQTKVRQHHFRESVENDKMAFDYLLREGPVQSGNALRLMRLVGLDVPLT